MDLCWRKGPGCLCWRSMSMPAPVGRNPGGSLRLWIHLRGLSPRAFAGMWRGACPGDRAGDVRGWHCTGATWTTSISRHIHPAERSHRNPSPEIGAWRTRPQVPMSALKSQIGHPQGACGAAGSGCDHRRHAGTGKFLPTINLDIAIRTVTWTMSPMPGAARSSTRSAIASPSVQRTRLLC